MKKRRLNKKGIELDMIGWWIIGLAVLVLFVIGYIILSGKGSGAMEFINNLFKFRS